MSYKLIDKIKLLVSLHTFKDSIKLENWNQFTRSWSKGYEKCAEDIYELVEQYEEENTDES